MLNPYNTHQPIFEKYILETTGDIIELGIGDGSTGFILNLIKNTNRKLISLENDKPWFYKIKNQFPPSDKHIYHFYNDYQKELSTIFCAYPNVSIAFIDSSPWNSRIFAMNHFIKHKSCDYLLIHDVDYFPKNNIFGTVLKGHTEDNPRIDFSDVSADFHLFYPPKPYPAPTGPPTLIISPINKKLIK